MNKPNAILALIPKGSEWGVLKISVVSLEDATTWCLGSYKEKEGFRHVLVGKN